MTGSYAASFLPWILIPVICWFFPFVVSALAFFYVESDADDSREAGGPAASNVTGN